MMKRNALTTMAAGLAFAGSALTANAATVDFEVVYDPGNSTFELFADASGGDHAGIAGYNVGLQNAVTFDHAVPRGVDKNGFFSKGFTAGTNDSSMTGPLTGGNAIFSGQNTSSSNAPDNLIYGIGQEAGTTSKENMLSGSEVVSQWEVPISIGTGTYESDLPSFSSASANVFTAVNDVNTTSADTTTSVTAIPEPTSLALLGLGGLAMLTRRKRA
jgi:hypothetical protein